MEVEALGSEGGERHDWTQSLVKGQRVASQQGAGSTHKRTGRVSVGAGGAAGEERPRWEPKLTVRTLLIHSGFGCLWPPGVYYTVQRAARREQSNRNTEHTKQKRPLTYISLISD